MPPASTFGDFWAAAAGAAIAELLALGVVVTVFLRAEAYRKMEWPVSRRLRTLVRTIRGPAAWGPV